MPAHLPPNHPAAEPCRLALRVRGVVQGVGFRPFIYNTARGLGLSGWVRNAADTVQIEVEGPLPAVEAFVDTLRRSPPPQARIDSLESTVMACRGDRSPFEIVASATQAAPRPTIPADLATCGDCLAEISAPGQRRFGYPFTNCTNCGPRWSIIAQLPYDRSKTTMAGFAMCSACRAEYEDPADRRFHAQPIACPACGPRLQALGWQDAAPGTEPLSAAVAALLAGQIVVLKGLGGFQLLADATCNEAVVRLRERKHRPDKPLALMMPSLDDVRARCEVSAEEAAALTSAQAPIVLLRRRDDATAAGDVAAAVATGNPYLGVMLPYTPLHHLLMAALRRPIVCTSGNRSEEPMAITTDEARQRLGTIADLMLTHDRPIVRPVDDSVVRVGSAGLQVYRRARGFAPLPIDVGCELPTILAVGGHLKNTVALSLGSQVVLSAHIGDLDNVLSVAAFHRAVDDLVSFFDRVPAAVACDLHPDYASTQHAERLAAQWRVPLMRVQHHHAHVAACIAEHWREIAADAGRAPSGDAPTSAPVLGFAWDGTGYGSDGTVWGGEALLCEGHRCERVAHLRTFALPGGDRAVREPRRSALGVLFELFGPAAADRAAAWFERAELPPLLSMLARSVHAPCTSSLGRLFDAVAALCGLGGSSSFEGQAAMALEFAADERETGAYPIAEMPAAATAGSMRGIDASAAHHVGQPPLMLDWEPLVRAVLADVDRGVPVGQISARFHHAIVDWAVAVARRVGVERVALGGGCFQNARLTDRLRLRLLQQGFKVYLPQVVPAGDGGIALGQVFVAAARAGERSQESGDRS